MKLSSLSDYLRDKNSYTTVIAEASNEVKRFEELSSRSGASISVVLVEDLDHFKMGAEELKTLCSSFLKGHLNKYFVSYIADALLLSSKVTFDDDIKSLVEELTDPEVNGELTRERVLEILIELEN